MIHKIWKIARFVGIGAITILGLATATSLTLGWLESRSNED